MSKTLFWYLLKDLLRIFFIASGALAGIMSFGGLLRPLTEHGLDMGQVGKMLTYLTPAMMTYSLPVAALFATTMVYGRLAADNELTACRACGISFFSIALPALVLGLVVAIFSLLLLCFIVPVFSLRVEQVIYSNIAKVVHNKIIRNHQVRFGGTGGGSVSVFAQDAKLLADDPARPGVQRVELVGPTIVTYDSIFREGGRLFTPREFLMARAAVVQIESGAAGGGGEAQLSVSLDEGMKFPREFKGAVQAGVSDTTFGPLVIPSMIRENVKFMDVHRLWELAIDPGKSERVQIALRDYVRADQERSFLSAIMDRINARDVTGGASTTRPTCVLDAALPEGMTYTLSAGAAGFNNDELVVNSPGAGGGRGVSFTESHGEDVSLTAEAREAHVRAKPDASTGRMAVSVELYDAVIHTPGTLPADRLSFARPFAVQMPPQVAALEGKTLKQFAADPMLPAADANRLRREQVVVNNAVRDELHSRASFAVSCLILVFVGCALGMMFKSGNFLSAFAVSFVPALLCITLIVSGQQTADHVPTIVTAANNPLKTGLWIIWSGNIAVFTFAAVLAAKLRRT